MPTQTLKFRGLDYPKRDRFFANQFMRVLAKTVAANDIGADGCWLLTLVVMTEDVRRYANAPNFYNEQLTAYMGDCSQKVLRRVRDRCVEEGWLHYEPGRKRRPGTYWVTIPLEYTDLQDAEPGEGHREFSGDEMDMKRALQREVERELQPAYKGHTSYPFPDPIPPPPNAAVVAVEKRLQETGLGKWAETIRESLSNGLTLDQVQSILDYWFSRPDAWGPGALRNRLVSPSAPALASDQGWPPPSPKEQQARIARERAAQSARLVQEQAAQSAQTARQDAESQTRKEATTQLELKFGQKLDQLSPGDHESLVREKPHVLDMYRKHGVRNPCVRRELLQAFAERYAEN